MPDKGNESNGTYLTVRQLEILKLRHEGLSTDNIAHVIGTTRQNVSILERRALRNFEKAVRTLGAMRDLKLSVDLEIPAGTHILDAVKQIVRAADESNIRLSDNLIGVMTRFKVATERELRNGVIQKNIQVMMFRNGTIQFFQ